MSNQEIRHNRTDTPKQLEADLYSALMQKAGTYLEAAEVVRTLPEQISKALENAREFIDLVYLGTHPSGLPNTGIEVNIASSHLGDNGELRNRAISGILVDAHRELGESLQEMGHRVFIRAEFRSPSKLTKGCYHFYLSLAVDSTEK